MEFRKIFIAVTCIYFSFLAAAESVLTGIELNVIDNAGVYEPDTYSTETLMPDLDTISIPYWFEGNPDDTEIEVRFNGETLDITDGLPLVVGDIGLMSIDLSQYVLLSGELSYTLKSTSEASFMIVTDVDALAITIEGNKEVSARGGDEVVLAASVVHDDGTPTEVEWRQVSGETVEIGETDKQNLTFTAPISLEDQTLEFQLYAHDGRVDTDELFVVKVAGENSASGATSSGSSGASSSPLFAILIALACLLRLRIRKDGA